MEWSYNLITVQHLMLLIHQTLINVEVHMAQLWVQVFIQFLQFHLHIHHRQRHAMQCHLRICQLMTNCSLRMGECLLLLLPLLKNLNFILWRGFFVYSVVLLLLCVISTNLIQVLLFFIQLSKKHLLLLVISLWKRVTKSVLHIYIIMNRRWSKTSTMF